MIRQMECTRRQLRCDSGRAPPAIRASVAVDDSQLEDRQMCHPQRQQGLETRSHAPFASRASVLAALAATDIRSRDAADTNEMKGSRAYPIREQSANAKSVVAGRAVPTATERGMRIEAFRSTRCCV